MADTNFQPLVFCFILKAELEVLTCLQLKVVIRSIIKIHGSFERVLLTYGDVTTDALFDLPGQMLHPGRPPLLPSFELELA